MLGTKTLIYDNLKTAVKDGWSKTAKEQDNFSWHSEPIMHIPLTVINTQFRLDGLIKQFPSKGTLSR